jgi:hypothetical protein
VGGMQEESVIKSNLDTLFQIQCRLLPLEPTFQNTQETYNDLMRVLTSYAVRGNSTTLAKGVCLAQLESQLLRIQGELVMWERNAATY